MEVLRTKSFEKDFAELPRLIQNQFERKLGLFLINPRHPSLRSKKMHGTYDVWEFRISEGYRCTFSLRGTVCILRRAGTHDILRTP